MGKRLVQTLVCDNDTHQEAANTNTIHKSPENTSRWEAAELKMRMAAMEMRS